MADIQNIIKSGKESLELSGKLMEIDINTGVLNVYSQWEEASRVNWQNC